MFSLQIKSLTQILKIEKICNNTIILQRKWKRKRNQEIQPVTTVKP
jgi:hypothetical protein